MKYIINKRTENDMATIEERAMISVLGDYPIEHIRNWKAPIGEHDQAEIRGYVNGATEQKQIDDEEYRKDMRYINIKKQEMIEKACEWLKNNINDYLYNGGGKNEYIPTCGDMLFEHFRKAMEE